jgi:phosphoribosylamine--glycine ligase
MDSGVEVFHAGTNLGGEGNIVTDGGRVVTVTATGETLSQARERAYDNVRRISFQGAHYRSDVALVAQGAAT